jgi:integrase/recombinase XerD
MKHLPIYTLEFERYLHEFNMELSVKNYSTTYQDKCHTQSREFLFFCEARDIISVHDIKAQDVLDYHDYISTRENQTGSGTLSEAMISGLLGSLRKFFDFLEDMSYLNSSPVKLPSYQRAKYSERAILTTEEIKLIYKVIKDSREKAIISIAYGCGLRRSEIQNLNIRDVLFHKGVLGACLTFNTNQH